VLPGAKQAHWASEQALIIYIIQTFRNVVCDVTLSVYPHQASLKNMPGHGGNQTYEPRCGYTLHNTNTEKNIYRCIVFNLFRCMFISIAWLIDLSPFEWNFDLDKSGQKIIWLSILQHFATKLRNITNFVMLFQTVMKFLSRRIYVDQNFTHKGKGLLSAPASSHRSL
jgi:hypothetical protein